MRSARRSGRNTAPSSADHRKDFLYGSSKKGGVGALAGTNGQYAFRVVLSGGSGETAYRTQSDELVMTITATPYMSDENAQNVIYVGACSRPDHKTAPALRIKAGATKEEAKALAEGSGKKHFFRKVYLQMLEILCIPVI